MSNLKSLKIKQSHTVGTVIGLFMSPILIKYGGGGGGGISLSDDPLEKYKKLICQKNVGKMKTVTVKESWWTIVKYLWIYVSVELNAYLMYVN